VSVWLGGCWVRGDLISRVGVLVVEKFPMELI
jgi:hypothetical protein